MNKPITKILYQAEQIQKQIKSALELDQSSDRLAVREIFLKILEVQEALIEAIRETNS